MQREERHREIEAFLVEGKRLFVADNERPGRLAIRCRSQPHDTIGSPACVEHSHDASRGAPDIDRERKAPQNSREPSIEIIDGPANEEIGIAARERAP